VKTSRCPFEKPDQCPFIRNQISEIEQAVVQARILGRRLNTKGESSRK